MPDLRDLSDGMETTDDDARDPSHHQQDREVKAGSIGLGPNDTRADREAANIRRHSREAARRSRALAGDRDAWHRAAEDMAAAERPDGWARQAAKQRRFRTRLGSPERAAAYSVAGRQQFGSRPEPRCRRSARHPAYRPSAARRCRDIAERRPGHEGCSRRSRAQGRGRFALLSCWHPPRMRPLVP